MAYVLNSLASKSKIPRGLMIRGGKARDGSSFMDEVAKAISAPTKCADGRESKEWILTLFNALAGTLTAHPGTWLQDFLSRVFRSCSDGTHGGTQEPSVQSERGRLPPIVVFDDFSTFDSADECFMKEVYQWAEKKRVLVFVLTDAKEVAYNLCQLNGMKRIKPLPGSFDNDPTALGVGQDIIWNDMIWSVEQLTRYVLHNYPEFKDNSQYTNNRSALTFLSRGMSPNDALEASKERLLPCDADTEERELFRASEQLRLTD